MLLKWYFVHEEVVWKTEHMKKEYKRKANF